MLSIVGVFEHAMRANRQTVVKLAMMLIGTTFREAAERSKRLLLIRGYRS